MNPIWTQKEFCADLTHDVASDEELALLCSRTVEAARRRRRASRARGVLVVLLAAVGGVIALKNPHQAPENIASIKAVSPPPEQTFRLIRSETLAQVITSEPFGAADEFFASVQPVAIVTSPESATYHELSDEQLLGFFPGRSVALVKLPQGALLEFLDAPQADERSR